MLRRICAYAYADFASNLMGCVDVNVRVPLSRWDVEGVDAPADILGGSALRFACFLDGVDSFDNGLFRLAKAEAVAMDPQCRVLLEQTFASLQVHPGIPIPKQHL